MPVESIELVKKDEQRKEELKKFGSEEYQRQYDQLTDLIKRNTGAFGNVNYVDGQMAAIETHTFKELLEAVRLGDKEAMDNLVIDYDKTEHNMSQKKSMDGSAVMAVNQSVKSFLQNYGLEKYVILKSGMSADEMQRAIDLGYESKMWELTHKLN